MAIDLRPVLFWHSALYYSKPTDYFSSDQRMLQPGLLPFTLNYNFKRPFRFPL